MKRIVAALFLGASLTSPAESFRLESASLPPGEAYHPSTNTMIEWQAQNSLPKALWIYKVIPQSFSGAVFTNLMSFGHFQQRDASIRQHTSIPDKSLVHFQDKNTKRNHSLVIAPTLGWAEYTDETGSARDPMADVPDNSQVEELGMDVLFLLGIDRSQVAEKPRSRYPSVRGKLDRNGKKLTETIFQRGVSFVRSIDGIQNTGKCFWIEFGNQATIKHFFLSWRNLLPYETRRIATPGEIMTSIKSGRSVATIQDFDWRGSLEAKKLTVTGVTLYYFDKPGTVELDFVYPYAELEMKAEITNSNTVVFYLQCPILSTNLFTVSGGR